MWRYWSCWGKRGTGEEEKKQQLRPKRTSRGASFSEIRQVWNKFALSSYHSWIFRAIKCENIKLNYACMKRWKSAVGHCSFSSCLSRATCSSPQPDPSFRLMTLPPTTFKLQTRACMWVLYHRCPFRRAVKNYSIPWWRLCGREWKHQKKKKLKKHGRHKQAGWAGCVGGEASTSWRIKQEAL